MWQRENHVPVPQQVEAGILLCEWRLMWCAMYSFSLHGAPGAQEPQTNWLDLDILLHFCFFHRGWAASYFLASTPREL